MSEKYEKLLTDMNLVKGNINLTNEMMDVSLPRDLASEDNPVNDLMKTLREMEPKLIQLVSNMDDDVMLNVCLLVNDDLHKTFARYDKLKKGKQPEKFVPGESKTLTPLNPAHIYVTGSRK